MPETSTTAGARDHARSQAGSTAATAPTIPASSATGLPPDITPDQMIWDETLGPGGYTSRVLTRSTRLRLVDLAGEACLNLLVYNANQPTERLNVADTVKVQWQAYLGAGSLLLSDMGRVLMSIVGDTSGHHDTFSGVSTQASNELRYGSGDNHGQHPNGRDRFALALAKHGLGRADITANINLFSGVRVDPDGSLRWIGSAGPAEVELRAEMDVLVVMANTPHVLDPRDDYAVGPVRVLAFDGPPTTADDACRIGSPESERAFLNTEDVLR